MSTAGHDVQAAFAATLVDEWVRCGVAHAVVCPGSRSTPMAVALADHPGVAVHVRLDERSAAFTALGIGLATGMPALVLTTSGTAAAELHAAVVEADLAGVALLVCTADRPAELRDVGAPQTIDQTHLYGRSVRWFADPGVPAGVTRSTWRSLAGRAVAEAVHGPAGPGPVHLNLPFREPLLGDPAAGGMPPGRADGGPWHAVATVPQPPPPDVVAELAAAAAAGCRGLVVAGGGCGDPDAVLALAAAAGWPVLADPRSGARRLHPRVVAAADGIARSEAFVASHRPDLAVVLGSPWASKVVHGLVAGAAAHGARVVAADPSGRWTDPDRVVATFVRCDPAALCRAVAEVVDGGVVGGRVKGGGVTAGVADVAARAQQGTDGAGGGPAVDGADVATGVGQEVGGPAEDVADVAAGAGQEVGGPVDSRWLDGWAEAEAAAQRVLGTELDHRPGPGSLSEPWLARRLVALLPGDATLLVSSSMPVRDVEAYAGPRADPPRVVANRGANGIDGVVSTALGLALGRPGSGPVVALVGDLAFLHDVSALVRSAGADVPCTVVVVDNGGGGIFSFLAPAQALDRPAFESLFGTPQASDVAAVAAGFGLPVDDIGRADGPEAFEAALARHLELDGLSVIRVRVGDRTANVAAHQRLNDALVAAVDAVTGRPV